MTDDAGDQGLAGAHPAPGGTPEQQLADEVLDRPAGEHYNPNPAEVVERNRARFDQVNREAIRGEDE